MKNNIKSKIVPSVILSIILFASATWFFIQSQSDKHDKAGGQDSSKTTSRVQVVNGIMTIELSAEERENSGITLVKLNKVLYQAQLSAYGAVVSISDLAKDVQSFEANKAQLAKSKENLLISQQNFERTKSLYEKKLASEQDFQSAQAAFLSDQADVNSASSNLSTQKSSIVEQWGNELSKWIFNGSSSLHNLLELKEELIQISLPPDETSIKTPLNIFIQSPTGTGSRISCRYVSTGHIANSQFQTKTLYYITSGASLNSGMNVKTFLPVGKNLNGVIVPASSIVWYQGKAWFYTEKFPDKFIRVEIDTDNPVGNGFFIPENKDIIYPDVTVVKNGAQLLLSKELTPAQSSQSDEGDND